MDEQKVRAVAARAATPVRDFFVGVRLLGQGLATYGRNPGLIVLGLLPALIAMLLLGGGFVVLLYFIRDLAAIVTWFAAQWSPSVRGPVRLVAGVGIVGVAGFLGVLVFTALTLAVGDPFYEKIAERVEDRFGGVPDAVDRPWWQELRRAVVEGARMVALSVVIGIPLFVAGFIPGIGQTVVPVVGATVGGWFLAVELTGAAFSRRGFDLAQRRVALRAHRSTVLGFGVAVFLCFLVPLGAVLVMPAAVAGGTLLARRVLGLPDTPSIPTKTLVRLQ